jgi:MFS family permease
LPIYILNDLNGTEAQAGLAMTIFMLSAIVVRPFAGKIIEMFGKRKTLLISELFFVISSFLYLFIDSLSILLALRLFHGIWFSIVTTVLIAIANDIVPESRKGAGLGYFAMSMNLAVVFGPFIGLATLQWFSYKILIIGLATAVLIGYLFAFTLKVPEYRPKATHMKFSRLTWRDLFETKAIPVAIVGGITAFAYASIMTFISVYAEERGLFEYVSLFFIVFAVAMIAVRPYTGRLYDTKGPSSVIYPSFIFFAAGLFLLSNIQSAWTLLFSGVLIGIGYGSIIPCFQALAIQSAEKHRSGHATSTFYTIFDSGMAAGAFLLGIVSAQWGFSVLYILCGAIIVLTIPVYLALVSRKIEVKSVESHQITNNHKHTHDKTS